MHYFIDTARDRAEFTVKGFTAEVDTGKDDVHRLYIMVDGNLACLEAWGPGTPRDEALEQAWAMVDGFLGTCREASGALAFLETHLDAIGAVWGGMPWQYL